MSGWISSTSTGAAACLSGGRGVYMWSGLMEVVGDGNGEKVDFDPKPNTKCVALGIGL